MTRKYKKIIIQIQKNNMWKNEKFDEEIKIIKSYQREILELKNSVNDIKN